MDIENEPNTLSDDDVVNAPAPAEGESADISSQAPPSAGGDNSPPAEGTADWRVQLEDQDLIKTAERYNTPKDAIKALREAQQKIRSGQLERGLPTDATDEQVAEYRAAHGIPDSPDKYELSLEEGLVLGEEDSRIMQEVFKVAHGEHLPAETLSKMTNAMLHARAVEAERIETRDRLQTQEAQRVLKEQWRGDFDVNLNLVQGFVNGLPAEIKELVRDARLPDGTALFNRPEVLDYFAQAQRQINPGATVVGIGGSAALPTIEQEIKTLEARMTDEDWHSDKEANDRLLKLYEAREGIQKQQG